MNMDPLILKLNTEYSTKIDALTAKAQELEDMNQFLRDENARLIEENAKMRGQLAPKRAIPMMEGIILR